ncbi:MAG TPA: DUF1800 domain-containing protein [Steroidobacteraceae bacterium]|jgi:uncharacterized protein (DUF1800 family)|nr:DUF1800 domain-containing protein [Steroidobacteraceae bacterium]
MVAPALDAAIAANRFGLGARPGELARIGGDARGWLAAQLAGGAPRLQGGELKGSADILSQAVQLRRERHDARATGAAQNADVAAVMKIAQLYRPIYVNETNARIGEALTTERPLLERLTYFWSNHFAVSVDKVAVSGLAGSFEREAIRPHVLGNFTDLLLASTRHPAMLLYLDNQISAGPNSQLAQRAARHASERRFGINENLAREILELHTLGVAGGYTQADVTSFAKVISGWSIGANRGALAGGSPGQFVFRPEMHEPGAQIVLAKRYAEGGMEQGLAVLRDLAQRPATAQFIATKLTRHFIADEPPPQAVERLARAFHDSNGDLPTVYRALLGLRECWTQALAKFKTPCEYIISSLRGLQIAENFADQARASFALLGQRIYAPGSPAGWPDRSADWDGSSAVMKRIEWADALGQKMGAHRDAAQLAPEWLGAGMSAATHTSIARAASGSQALTLLLSAPEFMRR